MTSEVGRLVLPRGRLWGRLLPLRRAGGVEQRQGRVAEEEGGEGEFQQKKNKLEQSFWRGVTVKVCPNLTARRGFYGY